MKYDFLTGLWLFSLLVNVAAAVFAWKKKDYRQLRQSLVILSGIIFFLTGQIFPAVSWVSVVGAIIFIVNGIAAVLELARRARERELAG